MRVFLTGATGYIGSAIADALQAAGHQVTGLVRSDEGAGRLQKRGIMPVPGDIQTPESFLHVVRSSDGVIHAANTNDANASLVDRGVVEAIVSALEGSDKPFVYTSGVWVLGNTGSTPADETAPLNPIPPVEWRPAVEDFVLDSASRRVRAIVIRPAMVYGRGGGAVAMMSGSANTGVVQYIGEGKNRWSFVHADDLADLYVRALEKAPAGTLYHAAEGSPVRISELAAAVAESAGKNVKIHSWVADEAALVLGPSVQGLLLDQNVSAAKAKRELGWEPKAPSVLAEVRQGSYAPR
jgi:nucleoside-diphosphate-sugar epimerase